MTSSTVTYIKDENKKTSFSPPEQGFIPQSSNTTIMATSLPSILVLLLSLVQIDALPKLAYKIEQRVELMSKVCLNYLFQLVFFLRCFFFACMHLYVVTPIYTKASYFFPLISIPHSDCLPSLVEKEVSLPARLQGKSHLFIPFLGIARPLS
jgi:hypothetical protein